MTIEEAKSAFYAKVALAVMNVSSRPYFKPLNKREAQRYLKSWHNMDMDLDMDLKTGKLTVKLEIDHGKK